MCSGIWIFCFKISTIFFCCPFFFEEYINPQVRINKMVNKFNIDSFRIYLKDISSYISINLLRLSLSKNFNKFSLKLVYPNMIVKKFQIYGVQILRKCTFKSKNWIWTYLLMPPVKTLPQILSSPSIQREITHSLRQRFLENLFSPSRKGGTIFALSKFSHIFNITFQIW